MQEKRPEKAPNLVFSRIAVAKKKHRIRLKSASKFGLLTLRVRVFRLNSSHEKNLLHPNFRIFRLDGPGPSFTQRRPHPRLGHGRRPNSGVPNNPQGFLEPPIRQRMVSQFPPGVRGR